MKNWMKWAIPALVVGAVAWGVAESRVDRYGGAFPVFFNKGIYVGPDSPNPTNNKLNKLTSSLNCECDLMFPAIPGTYTVCTGTTQFPNVCTCTGTKVGDVCQPTISYGAPFDGGSGWLRGLQVEALVRAPNVLEFCITNGTDAGAVGFQDAGFFARCESYQ